VGRVSPVKLAGYLAALVVCAAAPALVAQVFYSEFFSDPVSEGWGLIQRYCEPELWVERGWYHQVLDLDACPPGPQGGHDSYRRSLERFDGTTQFFAEFRIQTDGHSSEIPYGAPIVLVLGNDAGIGYHLTVARDLVQFYRAADLPIWFIEIEPGLTHTYRIELSADRYAFYIDAYLIDGGVADGPFPAYSPRITWLGNSWQLPCHNAWDYIRYGVIPQDASGDYDSDGLATLDDFYFVHECLTNDRPGIKCGPGHNAGPGCRFTDFDADGDTDLLDFAAFQNGFGGVH